VNKQLNRSWKSYIQNPTLLRTISRLRVPALFVYGEKDIRPSWPVEQVANLMPNAHFELIEGAEHIIWFSHPNGLKSILRDFVDDIRRNELLMEPQV
jgi:proline iminopeptidase